jgi:hypothetical protein
VAIQGYIPTLTATYPTQATQMNLNFANISQQMGNEQDLQYRAGLRFSDNYANLISNSQPAIFSFTMSLPQYGQDVQQGGTCQFIEAVADYNPFTGTLNATNLNSLSDREFKKNIIHIDNSIEVLQQIDGVEFQWVDSDKKSYGVIAQELEKILPELVEGTTKKSVNYSGLIAFLINAVKTLDNRVTELEKVINKQ